MDDKIDTISKAIANKSSLEIVCLKPSDEKTTKIVIPEAVCEMEYHGKKHLGMRAFRLKQHEGRTFRIDRILEIEVLGS